MDINKFRLEAEKILDYRFFPRKMTQKHMTMFDLLCMLSGAKYLPFMRIKTVFYKNKKLGVGSVGRECNSSENKKLFNKVFALNLPMDSKVRIKYHQSPRHCRFFYDDWGGYEYIHMRFNYITLYIN